MKVLDTQANPIRIHVDSEKGNVIECSAVILVPEEALEEAGYISIITAGARAHDKHSFHALAQTALMRFEEGELMPMTVNGALRIAGIGEDMEFERGLLIGRLPAADIILLVNSKEPVRKFLKTAFQFCTRSIRLDL